MLVQILDGDDELCDDKAGCMLPEVFASCDEFCEVAKSAVVEGHVEVIGGLEGIVELDDEGAVDLFQDVGLSNCIL